MFDSFASFRLYVVAGAVSCFASLILTPLIRRLAIKLDIVDRPDTHRKLHARETPLGGGIAIFAAFGIAVTVVTFFSISQRRVFANDTNFVLGVSLASLVICIVGILDDRFHLRGRQKLFGQVLAAVVIVASGLTVKGVQIFDWHIQLGLLSIPFTVFWLLGAINALNLIDGVDGLATGVGIVLSLSIAAIAALTGHRTETFLAIAMGGALVGFLRYNRAPATIFLGDAGSMLIGLVLGAIAIRGSFKGPATAALAAPTAILAIPIFDVSTAILRRRLTGRSIYTTDRGHLHHTLLKRGYSTTKTAVVFGLLCALTAGGAVISIAMNNELLAYAAIGSVLVLLIVTRSHGHRESRLLVQKLKHLAVSLIPVLHDPQTRPRELRSHLEGNQQWEDLWDTLAIFADRFDLHDVQLNIMLPAHGEEFHASWRRKKPTDEKDLWNCEMPLYASNISIGRLKISGASTRDDVCTWMSDLIAGLKPFEAHLQELISECIASATTMDAEPIAIIDVSVPFTDLEELQKTK